MGGGKERKGCCVAVLNFPHRIDRNLNKWVQMHARPLQCPKPWITVWMVLPKDHEVGVDPASEIRSVDGMLDDRW